MKRKNVIIALAGLAVFFAAGMSLTVTRQNEYKLVRQFGKVQRVIDQPGLSLKIPFIETTATLPKQTLLYDLAPSDWNEHLINPQNGHNLKILGLLPKNRKYRILILDLNDMRRYKATSDFIKLCRPTA